MIFLVLVFVGVKFYLVMNEQNPADTSFETAASSLERTIKHIKFKISSVKVVGKDSQKWNNEFVGNLSSLSAKTFDSLDEMLLSVVDNNFPIIISNSVAEQWQALHWDLWDLALPEKWPVLTKVLTIDTKYSGDTIFLMNHEKSEGGTLNTKCDDCSSLESPVVVPEMYLADFLFDLKNNTRRKHFYSTNYRIVETIAKVKLLFKILMALLIIF